jgi:hypothetical protein
MTVALHWNWRASHSTGIFLFMAAAGPTNFLSNRQPALLLSHRRHVSRSRSSRRHGSKPQAAASVRRSGHPEGFAHPSVSTPNRNVLIGAK